MTKKYGKLSTDQFCRLVGTLPEIRNQREELAAAVSSTPKHRLDELLLRSYNWGYLYEYRFVEHIALALVAFDAVGMLSAAVKSADPQQHMLDNLCTGEADVTAHPDLSHQDLLGIAFSLQRTILSVMLFQRSISGLVQEVREDDNLDSLFNAIRVDRAVMSCTTIADKIARAELCGDKRFFLRLRNALKGPTQKHWTAYCDLRYSLAALRELGFDRMSDAQLEQLLVHDLKVYPNTPSARKNLRAQYAQSRKIKTI